LKIKDERLKKVEYRVDIWSDKIIVGEKDGRYPINLEDRFLQFSVDIIKLLIKIPKAREFDVIRNQLSKSATSIGANYTESQAGSYAEFKQRIQICLREARETYYWLRVIHRLGIVSNKDKQVELKRLLQESKEIQLILGAISSKIKDKIKD